MTVSQIGIKLLLDGASAVVGGLTQVTSKLGDMDSATLKVGDAFKGLGPSIVGALSIGSIGAWLKSAIDAADETFNLSQKVGIAAKDLGGLQLAFKQTGVDAGSMQKALVTLSRNVLDGDKAFGELGVSVRNADGSLKGSKDVLYAVADVFADMPDGIEKTAYATQIFGKAGADLIPMLNGGSEGLREMADMAQRLGLVIDDQAAASADQFNDTVELLGLGLQGVGRQVAAQLLPTLSNLAGSLLNTMTQGDALKRTADFLATALKGLYSVAVGVVEVFDTVGKVLGGVAAAAMLAIKRDFAGAREALSAMKDDITAGWSKSGQAISKVWDETADNSILQAAKIVKAGNSVKESASEVTKEQQKAQKAAEDYALAGAKLAESLLLQDEGLSGDFKEKFDKLTAAYVAGKISLDDYQGATKQLIEQQPYWKAGLKATEQALKEEAAALLAAEKATLAAIAAREKEYIAVLQNTDSLRDELRAQEAANLTALTGVDYTGQLTIAKLRDAAATADRNALIAIERQENDVLADQYRQQAAGLRALADAKEQGIHIKAAQEANAEWQKVTDSINNGLTDALMRAFESGKGFFDAFKSTLVNAFKSMVLQPTIKAILAPVSGAIGSMFGFGNAMAGTGAAADAGSGLGSLLSAGSNLLNGGLGNMLGLNLVNSSLGQTLGLSTVQNIGGNMIAGPTGLGSMVGSGLGMLGNGMMGYGISKALSGGYSAGSWVNGLAGIASAIPGIGPIAGVVGGLVNRAFGMRAKEMKDAGITGTITGGDVTGNQFQDWFQKGGWFRSNKSGTDLTAMNSDLAAALDLGASGVLSQVQAYAAALQLPGEALKSVSSTFRVTLTGQADADQKAIAGVLEGYQTALSDRFASAIAPLMKAGETASEALQRLASLQSFTESINAFGGVFTRIAGSSIAAREHLIELAGGIDQLMAKAGAFVRDFYSTSEQAGLQARSISQALSAIGLDGGSLASREDFRRLVEGLDVSTEQGRTQLNALLDLAPQFAQLADYLQQQQITLEEAVAAAPQIAALEALRGEAEDQVAGIDNIGVQIEAGNSILAQISSGIAALQASIEAGLAQVASNTQATTRLLDSWDSGGALVTTTP